MKTLQEILKHIQEHDYEDVPDAELVLDGDWVSEGKYDIREVVFKLTDGRFVTIVQSRSGSYFTDYDRHDDEIYEVVPKEVTRIEYVSVNET